jgi:rubredoxin
MTEIEEDWQCPQCGKFNWHFLPGCHECGFRQPEEVRP